MLLRQDGDAVIAISQPAHAWVSGQLARAWGNARFASPSPHEAVCFAAEQHDIGWLTWEAAPGFDRPSGRPQTFMQLRPAIHTGLWREGVQRARIYGRYPALLVSLHAHTIYSRFFNFEKAEPEDAALVRAFLDEQLAVQESLLATLRTDPAYAEGSAPETVECNRLLVAAFDWMSLNLCWGVADATRIPDVPVSGSERIELTLRAGADNGVIVDPWPFRTERVCVQAEGRRLQGRFPDEGAMRYALEVAEPVQITIALTAPTKATPY
jgi:hypothetical protein